MKKILISGGTGMIGKELSKALTGRGYHVSILTRGDSRTAEYEYFHWEIEKGTIDKNAFTDLDYIIHLAGENLGASRWTKKRKIQLINSRVKGSELLFNYVKQNDVKLKAFISASAVGIYSVSSDEGELYSESSPAGNNYAAQMCIAWENAADNFSKIGTRTVKIRTGLVQDVYDPALKKILQLAKFGILPVFGRGKHFYPWIHIQDLVSIYISAIENENMEGPFNAVAPELISNIGYIKKIKDTLGKGLIIKIPAFIFKLMFGEMSEIILKGTKIKSKLHDNDYKFMFSTLESAMKDLLK